MRLNTIRKLTVLSLATTVSFVGIGSVEAKPEIESTSNVKVFDGDFTEKALTNTLKYNVVTGKYELDEKIALTYGVSKETVRELAKNLENLSTTEVEALNAIIGFAPEGLESFSGAQPRALPAILVPVLKAVGKGAASAISGAVTRWGVSEACNKLEGEYEEFDSFCDANGW